MPLANVPGKKRPARRMDSGKLLSKVMDPRGPRLAPDKAARRMGPGFAHSCVISSGKSARDESVITIPAGLHRSAGVKINETSTSVG